MSLSIVLCPGCGKRVARKNRGCPHCGYENGHDGRLLSIAEIIDRPNEPSAELNNVCPAFIRAIVDAARKD